MFVLFSLSFSTDYEKLKLPGKKKIHIISFNYLLDFKITEAGQDIFGESVITVAYQPHFQVSG